MLGTRVVSIRNFEKETIHDVEGDLIPKEKMSIFELEDRTRVAVRASGTEPKIKYYLFAQRRPEKGKFDAGRVGSDEEGSRAHGLNGFGIGWSRMRIAGWAPNRYGKWAAWQLAFA